MNRRFLTLLAILLLAATVHARSVSGGHEDAAPADIPSSLPTLAPTNVPISTSADASTNTDVRVIRIIDGDSMIVDLGGYPVELRLIGIDAPEYGQEWGEEAENFAYEWTNGQLLTLELGPQRTDKYNRLLAYVWNGERMLNEELVRAGLALPYMLKKHEPHYQEIHNALRQAKAAKAGFWKQGGLEMEPRSWRKKHK